MANGVGGKSEETDHLLVVVVDISEAFSMSLAAENPSQRVSCLMIKLARTLTTVAFSPLSLYFHLDSSSPFTSVSTVL